MRRRRAVAGCRFAGYEPTSSWYLVAMPRMRSLAFGMTGSENPAPVTKSAPEVAIALNSRSRFSTLPFVDQPLLDDLGDVERIWRNERFREFRATSLKFPRSLRLPCGSGTTCPPRLGTRSCGASSHQRRDAARALPHFRSSPRTARQWRRDEPQCTAQRDSRLLRPDPRTLPVAQQAQDTGRSPKCSPIASCPLRSATCHGCPDHKGQHYWNLCSCSAGHFPRGSTGTPQNEASPSTNRRALS